MRTLLLGLAGLSLCCATGCSTVAPFDASPALAAGAPTYQTGRAIQAFPASTELIGPSRVAMEEVGVHTITERKEERATVLEGTTAAGRHAVVTIQPEGASTVVSARFGALGDEPLSRAFLDRLNSAKGKTLAAESKTVPAIASRRPTPNRASRSSGSILENQLEGGYRDSVSP